MPKLLHLCTLLASGLLILYGSKIATCKVCGPYEVNLLKQTHVLKWYMCGKHHIDTWHCNAITLFAQYTDTILGVIVSTIGRAYEVTEREREDLFWPRITLVTASVLKTTCNEYLPLRCALTNRIRGFIPGSIQQPSIESGRFGFIKINVYVVDEENKWRLGARRELATM